ncbi:MAG TPA: CBS domain-containing protein, partial [Polyangiaceae bacterium]|nr:CBS domain-containing protein [Polyangiaceae bacterium]
MPQPQILDEVMTRNPRTLPYSSTVRQAAQEMKREAVGAIVVEAEGKPCGIVTDRDIVLRCVASGANCDEMTLGSIC